MKHAYFTVLIAGVFLVLAGIALVIFLVATGRTGGDGFYITNRDERASIKGRDTDDRMDPLNRLDAPAANESDHIENNDIEKDQVVGSAFVDVVGIAGHDSTQTISRPSEVIDVTVSGSGHTITIADESTVRFLGISGSEHFVTLKEGSDVSRISVSGSDNVIIVPEGAEYTLNDAGVRTQVAVSAGQADSAGE